MTLGTNKLVQTASRAAPHVLSIIRGGPWTIAALFRARAELEPGWHSARAAR